MRPAWRCARRFRGARLAAESALGQGGRSLKRRYLVPIYIVALVLSPFWVWLIAEILFSLFDQLGAVAPTEPNERRAHFYALGLTITGLGAVLAAPFILIKAWVNERQARTAEQGHITDRITRAIEQLGAEKTVYEDGQAQTRPNLEVRLGAIYALERIAEDSERDHIPIMETLCAYVRENAKARAPRDLNLAPWEPLPDDADEAMKERRAEDRRARFGAGFSGNVREWERSLPAPRADVQAALTVISRRSEARLAYETGKEFRLDLRAANLQRADLNRARLGPARLDGARLEGAVLVTAKMERASLLRVKMEGANLSGAVMEGAILHGARMEGAHLRGARLKSADLEFLSCARANARSADFTDAKNMTQEQANSLFGDRATMLPEGLARTDLMDREPLEDPFGRDPDYKPWLEAGAPPGRPLG